MSSNGAEKTVMTLLRRDCPAVRSRSCRRQPEKLGCRVSRCTVDRSSTSGSAETFAAVNCVKAGVSSVDILPFFVVVNRVGLSPSSLSTVSGRSSSVFGTSSRRLPAAVWVEVACSSSGCVVAGRWSLPTAVVAVPWDRCSSSDGHSGELLSDPSCFVDSRSRNKFVVGCSRQPAVPVFRVVDSRTVVVQERARLSGHTSELFTVAWGHFLMF